VEGVFDIEDLVDVLKRENARNLVVIKLPKEIKYVDYFCLVDGVSHRHMIGMAEFVRRCYKMKRSKGDRIPKIEGEKCKSWMAMDLGNIALHIFTKQAREFYDLETLWCLGEEYEKKIRGADRKEEIYQMYLDKAAEGPRSLIENKEEEEEVVDADWVELREQRDEK
jgi:ribosome silencing factor RsfS/YbeB/iojap